MLRRLAFLTLVAGTAAPALGIVAAIGAARGAIEATGICRDAVKRSSVGTAGYAEIGLRDAQIWVTIVNNSLNVTPAAKREPEAAPIVVAILQSIKRQPDLVHGLGMRVDHVTQGDFNNNAGLVDGIDVYESPGGTFAQHTS
jgi:hypothetical protein